MTLPTISDSDEVPSSYFNEVKTRLDGLDSGAEDGVVINVKNPTYGATGDGVTDDTSAIQAALAAAKTAGAATVIFPKGTYLVSASVTTTDANDIVIKGEGNPLIQVTGTGAHGIFVFQRCNRIEVVGLRFKGNNVATADSTEGTAVYFGNASATTHLSDHVVRGCAFEDFKGAGWVRWVQSDATYDIRRIRVVDNRFSGGGDRDPTNLGVAAHQIYGVVDGAAHIQDVFVCGNHCDANHVKSGIAFLSTSSGYIQDGVIQGNIVRNNGQANAATVVGAYGILIYNAVRRWTITGNLVKDAYTAGMYLLDLEESTVTANHVEGQDETDDGTLLRAGIALPQAKNVTCTGNIVKDCVFGISVIPYSGAEDSGVVISSNVVVDCTTSIKLTQNTGGAAAGVTIAGNRIEGGTGNGITAWQGAGGNSLSNVRITDNFIECGNHGIFAQDAVYQDLTISGNEIRCAGLYGINLNAGSTNGARIQGNYINGGTVYALYVRTVDDVTITDNTIENYGDGDSGGYAYNLDRAKGHLWGNVARNANSPAGIVIDTAGAEDLGRDTPTFTAGRGTLVQSLLPSASGTIGWVNVDGGTTWKAWGSIAA